MQEKLDVSYCDTNRGQHIISNTASNSNIITQRSKQEIIQRLDPGRRKIRGRISNHPLKRRIYNEKINSDKEIFTNGEVYHKVLLEDG